MFGDFDGDGRLDLLSGRRGGGLIKKSSGIGSLVRIARVRAEGTGAELKAQIPWLRVFVEGVVIVGKLEN